MITEYPAEERRYDGAEYEPFWAAAQDLNMPLSLHTATARKGPNRAAGPTSVRTASGRANKVFLPATSLCDIIFSGVFERYPRLNVAVVEFELAWAPHLLGTMDYTYIERQKEASYRFQGDVLPSDFFRRNVYLSFQEDGIGIRLRDVIGVDRLMWGSDYPHAESTFPKSREILESILEGVPQDEKAQIVGANAAQLYGFDTKKHRVGLTLFSTVLQTLPRRSEFLIRLIRFKTPFPGFMGCSPTGLPLIWSDSPPLMRVRAFSLSAVIRAAVRIREPHPVILVATGIQGPCCV